LLHPDWSRALPQPLLIPDVMILATLADARELMRHLPEIAALGRRGAKSRRILKPQPPAEISKARLSGCAWC
jgi:hypothetical protein